MITSPITAALKRGILRIHLLNLPSDYFIEIRDCGLIKNLLKFYESGLLIFGILTTQNEEQELDRALSDRMNKGKEFAETAIEMIGIYHQL